MLGIGKEKKGLVLRNLYAVSKEVVEYSLTFKPSAAKELEAVADAATLARLVERIQSLASLPRPSGSKKTGCKDKPVPYSSRQLSDNLLYL
jgi:hypothetical protein